MMMMIKLNFFSTMTSTMTSVTMMTMMMMMVMMKITVINPNLFEMFLEI